VKQDVSRVRSLDWFPKRFQPGDMDSTGGERLLGRTELSPLEILIRETAQNSWDARLEDQRPWFGVKLRRADQLLRADLNLLLSTSDSNRSNPIVSSNPFLLEIADRNTTGLDGPVTLRPVPGDAPRNFQDLILKLGVPRDDGKGGGTYGFGKTASYAFSRSGTILYWTRCVNEGGELEHRLIASAFRDAYVESGVQFTGRHWWGRSAGDEILPLVGEEAEALGNRFFSRGFNGDETGTSMLIIDADLSAESLGSDLATDEPKAIGEDWAISEFAARSRSAIRMHLWPKMIPRPGESSPPMDISLEVDGVEHELISDPLGALALWGAGINAIRSERGELPAPTLTPQGLRVHVYPVTRWRKVLGHLAVVQRIPALERQLEHDDLDPAHNPAVSRIALMRGQAELIVSTVNWVAQSPMEGVDWLAVYKSADEWDATYARTEPPAHDAWIASSGGEEGLIVRMTRKRVESIIREALYPEPGVAASERQPVHTGRLSRRFASLLPARVEPEEQREGYERGSSPRGPRNSKVHSVEASPPRLVTTFDDGRQRQRIEFTVKSGGARSIVTLRVSLIGDEGVHEPLPADALDIIWHGAEAAGSSQAIVGPEGMPSVEFTAVGRRALRIDLAGEPYDGDH